MFETLESRRLRSGGGETLFISGTTGPDSIIITQTPANIVVTINGVTVNHARSWVNPSPNQYTPPSYGFLSGIQVSAGDSNDVYTVISVDLAANTITLRNPWGTDAGGAANGGWVQGSDDGYITITLAEWQDNFGSSYGAAV